MTEASDSTPRRELREEYFKVVDILQSYDPYFLTIKNWGVTVSGAAIALSVSQKSSSAFLLVCVLALGFWTTEVRFKLLQLGHTLRATELERYLSDPDTAASKPQSPRVLGAFGEESALNIRHHRWRSVFLWPQVMFPHVFFVAVGILGFLLAPFLLRK
jgi:hypothetical protein